MLGRVGGFLHIPPGPSLLGILHMVTLPFLSQPGIAKTGTRGLDCQHETNEVVTTRALGHTHTHPWKVKRWGRGGGRQGSGGREGMGREREQGKSDQCCPP